MIPEFLDLNSFCYFQNSVNIEFYDLFFNPFNSNGYNYFYYYSYFNNNNVLVIYYDFFSSDLWLHTWLKASNVYYYRIMWPDQLTWYWINRDLLYDPDYIWSDYMHTVSTCLYNYYWNKNPDVVYEEGIIYRIYSWENMYHWFGYTLYNNMYTYSCIYICESYDWFNKVPYVLPLNVYWFSDIYCIKSNFNLFILNNILIKIYDQFILFIYYNIFHFSFDFLFFIDYRLKLFFGLFLFSVVLNYFIKLVNFFLFIFNFKKLKLYIQCNLFYLFLEKGPVINKKWRLLSMYYNWQILNAMGKDLSPQVFFQKKMEFLKMLFVK